MVQATAWRLVAVITLLAAALDLLLLSAQPIWFDEALGIVLARMDLHDFLTIGISREPFMIICDLLHRIPLAFSQSEFAARSLSMIFVVAAVPTLYLLGRRLF